MYNVLEDLQPFHDLPQIHMEPNGPLDDDPFLYSSFQRQMSIPRSDCNPQGRREFYDMLWGQRSPETLHLDYRIDQTMPFYSGRTQRAPEPTIVHDGWFPTETYPHSVKQNRMPSPVGSINELSEGSSSSIGGPLSPAVTFFPEQFYSSHYSSVSFPNFPRSEEDYSSRQNHDLLHISGPRGRSGAHDTFVSMPQLQQCPDTLAEDNISLAGPRSPSSLTLLMGGHVEHDSALDEDLAFRSSDSHNLEMNISHSQLTSEPGHDSGIGSSATDEDIDMDAEADEGDDDVDADAEAEMVSEDDNGDTSAESDYEPPLTPQNRRQSQGGPQQTRRSRGKASVAKNLPAKSQSRRPSTGYKGSKHRVTKSTGSVKAPRALVSKQKDKSSSTRPFPCLLRPLCESTFTSKNEWKRHISTRHLQLGEWRCPFNQCARKRQTETFPQSAGAAAAAAAAAAATAAAAHDALQSPSSATISHDENMEKSCFNRKDLFSQHLRRMHMENFPGTAAPALPDNLAQFLTSQHFPIRHPPRNATCFLCQKRYEGETAWDQRIECLGKHFGDPSSTAGTWGGEPDQEFIAWMIDEGLLLRDGQGNLEFPKK